MNNRTYIFILFLLLAYIVTPLSVFALSKPPSMLSLVGYWSFNDGSGTIAGDFSGNRNSATFAGDTAWTTGRRGSALTFDGSGDYVDAGNVSILKPTGDATVSVWIKTSDSTTRRIMGNRSATGNNAGWELVVVSNKARFQVDDDVDVQQINSSTDVNTGNWVHIVGVRSGTTLLVYINGVSEGTPSGSLSGDMGTNASNMQIGRSPVSATGMLGQIDDVRVYNRALSASEIASLYRMGTVTFKTVSNNGLLGYWSLDDGSGTVATDFSGNRRNGTLAAGMTSADWINGRRGKALDFDGGATDYVDLPLGLIKSSIGSMSVWFKTSTNFSNSPLIFYGGNNDLGGDGDGFGAQNELHINLNASEQVQFFIEGGSSDVTLTSTNSYNDGKWHHALATWDITGSAILYIDGVLETQATHDATNFTVVNYTRLGKPTDTGSGPSRRFTGQIDEARLYNRVLTESEVTALYREGAVKANASQASRVTNGLVGYWSFNGPDVIDVVSDGSGNENVGYVYNRATSTLKTTGKVGQGFSFDKVDGFVNVGSATTLDDVRPVTYSWWMLPRSTGEGNNGIVFTKTNVRLEYAQGSNRFRFVGITGGTALVREPSSTLLVPTKGQWYHVAVTWDGTSTATGVKFYINGAEASSYLVTQNGSASVQTDESADLLIGNNSSGSGTFDGTLDELRIYNRILSTSEILQLYNMGR